MREECKMEVITIDLKRCKGCGYCAAFCPANVYEMGADSRPQVRREEACTRCQMCVKRCPDFAIHVKER